MGSSVLTLVAARDGGLGRTTIDAVRDAAGGGQLAWLSASEAADVLLDRSLDMDAVRAAIGSARVDAVVQPAAGRRKRLLIADMDSTVVQGETLDELAALAGIGEAVAAITRRSMNGEIDFAAALRERVAMLRGAPAALLDRTWAGVRLTPGARSLVATMRAHGAVTALVSGGFTWFTARVAAECGFDQHRANVLELAGSALAGTVAEPILDRDAKRTLLLDLAAKHGVPMAETLAVGDGANDLAMLAEAGLGVAYRAKPVVAASAHARIDHADLRALLFVQGYLAGDIVET